MWSRRSPRVSTCNRRGGHVDPSVENILEGECFAAVILNDVLEHVPDPLSFVRQVRRGSQPNGVVQDLKGGARVVPKDLNPGEHLSSFTPHPLHAAMARVAWRIKRGIYFASVRPSGLFAFAP